MKLIGAIETIHEHAIGAKCAKAPTVRVQFHDQLDQVAFRRALLTGRTADAPIVDRAGRFGSDCFEIAGIDVELCNGDRGSRAMAAKMIEDAAKALAHGSRPKIGNAEIIGMRQALTDLLNLVRGQ